MTFKSFFTISALTLSVLTFNLTNTAQEISTMAEFNAHVAQSAQPVIVKFSSVTCPPCRAFAPIFDEISNHPTYANVKFVKVDTQKGYAISDNCGVRSIPTTIFYKNGQELGRIVGGPTKNDFVNKIKHHFAI